MTYPDMDEMMDARQGCLTVLVKAIKNIFFYGIATFWVRFIGGYIWWLGVVLFAILALTIVANIVMYVVSTISFLRPKSAFERLEAKYAPSSDNLYLVAASISRGLKEAICVAFVVYLYRFFF
jgi:hypothetical protein